jgi:hypothetical protein
MVLRRTPHGGGVRSSVNPTLRGDRGPFVLVGGMQPAAAEIERQAGAAQGPGAPADARACLQHHGGNLGRGKAPRRRYAGRAGSDDDDVCFSHVTVSGP